MKEQIKGVIFDVDGVLEFQDKVYPGAVETLDTLREKGIILRFLTNSTLKSRESCAQKLQRAGFQVFCEEVITASYATAKYLEGLRPASCWIMLEREGLDEFKNFPQDTENPEYIVIGDNRSKFDFEHLNKALRLLLNGTKLIGIIPELLDSSLGEFELNVGSWVSMLERASGIKATYIGKPGRYMFDLTLNTMKLQKPEVIMVGDTLSTDIKGARNVGIKSILLKTGEFFNKKPIDTTIQPDFIFDCIQDILQIF
jgi:HAD superfamily hydrolase (TIGR01458 family)